MFSLLCRLSDEQINCIDDINPVTVIFRENVPILFYKKHVWIVPSLMGVIFPMVKHDMILIQCETIMSTREHVVHNRTYLRWCFRQLFLSPPVHNSRHFGRRQHQMHSFV